MEKSETFSIKQWNGHINVYHKNGGMESFDENGVLLLTIAMEKDTTYEIIQNPPNVIPYVPSQLTEEDIKEKEQIMATRREKVNIAVKEIINSGEVTKAIADYYSGKVGVLNYIAGIIMKKNKGLWHPFVKEVLEKELKILEKE